MNDTMEDNKDVDALYDELKSTLDKASEEEESSGASAQEPAPVDPTSVVDEGGELSEDEISKLTPRAQKRIRELADKVKELAETPPATVAEETPIEPAPETPDFKNVQDFLAAVEDEPSRKLLETFYGVIKGEISSTLSPIEQKNNETLFETQFAQFEKIEGLADHKSDLRKTFLRDPSQDLKRLVGEIVVDMWIRRIWIKTSSTTCLKSLRCPKPPYSLSQTHYVRRQLQ
jgi:hypothetical protein